MAVELTAFTYLAPIMAFLIVFLVSFAVLFKSQLLGESKWGLLFVSFVIASLFVSAAGLRTYVETVTPWFGALLVSLFFLLVLVGFVGGKTDGAITTLRWVFLIGALLVFLISGVVVFSDSIGGYLPGYSYEGNLVTDWLYSGPVVGAILLIIITAAASWVLVKAK